MTASFTKAHAMNMEEIKTQLVGVFTNIIDIYEKSSKLTTKDIDTIVTNVTALNKKNMLVKKLYDLEEDIGKLKMLIIKASLLSSVDTKQDTENDPGQVVEDKEKEEKAKKVKQTKSEEDDGKKVKKVKTAQCEDGEAEKKPKKSKSTVSEVEVQVQVQDVEKEQQQQQLQQPIVEDAKAKKSKVNKKKVDVSEETKDTKDTNETKKKEIEPAKSPEAQAEPEEGGKQETSADDLQQPLHMRRKKIPKQIKTLVWNEYIGHDIMSNKCMCCKKEKIDVRNFHCGHVIAESKGGDLTIKNLRPICAPCNLSMGTMSMNEFTKTFFGWEV
jgi:hypothetical protein